MSPADRDLRLVELLPGGEQITSRPLHVVAYMDDHGDAVVQKSESGDPGEALALLSTLLAATAAWLGFPPAVVASRAASIVDHIYTQEAGDE